MFIEEEIHYKKFDHVNLIPNYEKYGQKLNEMHNTCTRTLDMRNAFDQQKETIFHDAGHVGDKGNKIIAEKMYEEILPIVIKNTHKSNT